MDFINFPEANAQRTAPKGMEATVGTLPVYTDGQQSISCIAAGLPVWLGVQGDQPPVWVSGTKPDMPAVVHEPSLKMQCALSYIAQLLPIPSEVAHGLRPVGELLAQDPGLRNAYGLKLQGDGLAYLVDQASQLEHYAALLEAYRQQGQAGVVAYLQPYAAFLPQEVITLSA
jgi:hypothetical protein